MEKPPVPVPGNLPQRECRTCNLQMDVADRVYLLVTLEEGQMSSTDGLPVIAYVCPKCGAVATYSAEVHMSDAVQAPQR